MREQNAAKIARFVLRGETGSNVCLLPDFLHRNLDIRADVGRILGELCRRKGIEIIEAEVMPDHIHTYAGENSS